jgi:hypothetical protein
VSLALAICYAVVAALLLNLNVASAWGWKVKVGAILLVSALYGVSWYGIVGLEGWPSGEPMPDRFRLQWVAIDEPDPEGGDTGGIYFWIRHFRDDGRTTPPRAHVLPFDDDNADTARDALALLEEGKRVEGRITMQSIEPEDERSEEEVDPQEAEQPAGDRPQDLPRFEFREMAPPDLPPKPVL